MQGFHLGPWTAWSQHPYLLSLHVARLADLSGLAAQLCGLSSGIRMSSSIPDTGLSALALNPHWMYFPYSLLIFSYHSLNSITYAMSISLISVGLSPTQSHLSSSHPGRSYYTMTCVPYFTVSRIVLKYLNHFIPLFK